MDFKELERLIRLFEDSDLSEMELEEDGQRMRLRKNPPASAVPPAVSYTSMETPVHPAPPETPSEPSPAEQERAGGVASENPESEIGEGLLTIDSPMVGTFYRAPAPGEDPFVREGDRVEENETVCIVEAMKLMNEVTAKVAGIVEKVLVENGEPVEFGQPLFALRQL